MRAEILLRLQILLELLVVQTVQWHPLSVVLSLQRFPTDRAYFIAKELLTTERTYLKDLEVITVVSRAKSALQHTAWLFVFSCAVLRVENIDYSG